MSEERSHLESQFESQVEGLDGFIEQVQSFDVGASEADVVKRFVRDCNTLKDDMFSKEQPSHADIVDYDDYFNMLDCRFHNLKKALK